MIPTWQKRNGNSFVKQDSTPKCRIMPSPRSKLHQMKYIAVDPTSDGGKDLIAASTEDGRVIFYSTEKLQQAEDDPDSSIPFAGAVAQIGGKAAGLPGRVKDFEIFNLKDVPATKESGFLVVTGNSDGAVRVWMVDEKDLIGFERPRITTGWSFHIGDDGIISYKGNDVYAEKKDTHQVFTDSKPLRTVVALREALHEEGLIA